MFAEAKKSKYLVPVAVLAVALIALTGSAYAYTATYKDGATGGDVTEKYNVIVNDGALVSGVVPLDLVGNTTTEKNDGKWVTSTEFKFYKTSDKSEVTEFTYTLKVKLVDQNGNAVSGKTIKGTATEVAPASGKTSAATVPEDVTGTTDADGKCTLEFTATLINPTTVDPTDMKDYVVPAYNFVLTYTYE